MEWVTEIEPTIIKLPPTTEQTVAIENLQNYFEYKGVVTKNLLDNMQKIRQLCADPALLKLSGGSPKTDWVVTYLKENPDKYVIIFSLSTKYINLLTTQFEKLNIKHTKIVGDTPILERQTNINMFQNGVSKVLLIQTLCGKEGYTLDSADTAIFLDMYPPAGAFKQAEDRLVATSPAALKPQELIHVMLRGTYDERLFKLVADNIAETEVLNDYHKYINKEVR